MKRIFTITMFLLYGVTFSQVGINNTAPTATLDITARAASGTSTTVDGLIVPRVDRQRAQSMTSVPTSTIIYINDISTGALTGTAINIDAVGLYTYNGTVWTKVSSGGNNIYNADGTLTGNRTVSMGSNNLAFTGSGKVGVNNATPGSTLDINGSLAASYKTVTTNYTMTATDYHVSYTGTANATFTLPAAISGAGNFKGRLYTIKNNTSFTITVNPSGTETINGNSNLSITANQSVQLINTGLTGTASTWEVLGYNTTSTAGTACVPDYVVADIPVTGQTITATGNDILFNNVLTSSGSVTPNASGVFTLKAGITYRLYSSLYGNFSNPATGGIYWDWVDAITNTKLTGSTTGLLSALTYTGSGGSVQPVSEAIYTPVTNQTVKVRVTSLINGPVGLSAGQGYCRVVINQLNACSTGGGSGSSVTASNGLAASSNNVTLGGNLSAATTLTNNGNDLNIAGSASTTTFASNGNVGIGTSSPQAVLDITSINSGILPPRLTTTQRDAISPKPAGLMIYNTDANCLQYWNSTQWIGSCSSNPSGVATIIDCTTGTLSGTYQQGSTMTSGNTITLAINVTQLGSWTSSSTTVNGITFVGGGTFNSIGAQNIILTASGTPTANGTFSTTFTLGSSTCSKGITFTPTLILPGNTQSWMRHNLGANTSLDPDTPVQAIHGNYYQWGRATVVADASTSSGAIAGWNTTNAPDGSWLDASKTANDPCPTGFRVPTSTQWTNLINNTTQSNVGTFTNSPTNFGSARVFTGGGNKLTLPAAGFRDYIDGTLSNRGSDGDYWSATQTTSLNAGNLTFGSSFGGVYSNNRKYGFSVRCISE